MTEEILNVMNAIGSLPDHERQQLLLAYYRGESPKQLCLRHGLSIKTPANLYKAFPPEKTNQNCPACKSALYAFFPARRSVSIRFFDLSSYDFIPADVKCPECGHADSDRCRCDYCNGLAISRQQADYQKKQQAILEANLSGKETPCHICALSPTEIIYLSALISGSASEDMTAIGPVSRSPYPLAPTNEYASKIIEHLFSIGAIIYHPNTPIWSIDFEGYAIKNPLPLGCVYTLNVCDDEGNPVNPNIFLDAREMIGNGAGEEDLAELSKLWKDIALEESIAYLQKKLQEYRLPSDIGEKTKAALSYALRNFSASQVFNFIWSATKNAAAFLQKGGITKQHAVNTIAKNIQGRADQTMAENWSVKGYSRDHDLERSVLAAILFDQVLMVGDRGFTEPPHMVELPLSIRVGIGLESLPSVEPL